MEVLLQIEAKDYQKVREILLKDEIVSRASIIFKDSKLFDREGYLCYISGSEDQCKRTLELIKIKPKEESEEVIELAKEVKDKEKEEIINKIKKEEHTAMEGFGGIFG